MLDCNRVFPLFSGCLDSFRKSDSQTGLLTLATGTSLVTVTGEPPCPFGPVKIWKKLCALAPLLSLRSWVVSRTSLISTERALIISLFLRRLAEDNSSVLKKCLIAGSNLDLCPMLHSTILSRTRRSLPTSSLPISSLRVSIKLVVGSIRSLSFLLICLTSLLQRTSLSVVSSLLRTYLLFFVYRMCGH